MTGTPLGTERARCPCGHDRAHPRVQEKARYGFWAWLALAMGATVVPYRLDFVCAQCGTVFDRTTDPAELQRQV